MTLPPLTPDVLYRLSPEGRLEEHESTLAAIEGKLPPEFDLSFYRRCIEVARANWVNDYWSARVYLEKADKELLDLQWRRSMEVRVGSAQVNGDRQRPGSRKTTLQTIARMLAHKKAGMNPSAAAKAAHAEGHGTSPEANYKAWKRAMKKARDNP